MVEEGPEYYQDVINAGISLNFTFLSTNLRPVVMYIITPHPSTKSNFFCYDSNKLLLEAKHVNATKMQAPLREETALLKDLSFPAVILALSKCPQSESMIILST